MSPESCPNSFHWTVRGCVNALISVLVLLGVGLGSALYWFDTVSIRHEFVKNDYRLGSILALVHLKEELAQADALLAARGDGGPTDPQSGSTLDARQRELTKSLHIMAGFVSQLRGKQQQYGSSEFAGTRNRLEEAFGRLKSEHEERAGEGDGGRILARRCVRVCEVAEQLRRLHVTGLAKANAEHVAWETRTMRMFVIIATFLLIVAGVAIWRLKKLINSLMIRQQRNESELQVRVVELQASNEQRREIQIELEATAAELWAKSEELKQAQRKAEQANKAKSVFLTNMSHEIRTPMTAILGFTEVLLDDATNPENIEAAETIKRNGDHLLELINDIRDLSKIEARMTELERIPCSPRDIVSDVISLLSARAGAKGVALVPTLVGSIPERIKTDPTRLRQILINLVGNAVKFTDNGSVRLETRHLDDGEGGPRLQFDVVDTGAGMSEDQVAKLFQPFTQADATTTRRFGGTGLGLTISKKFAEMLGGDVVLVETQEQVGSTFRATVACKGLRSAGPSEDASKQNQEVRHDAAPTDLHGLRILLAEDGFDNQRLISLVLRKAGAEVETQENGKLAVDAAFAARASGRRFDVILMDIQMPVMDGYEATGTLREQGYKGPIIALTANAMAGDREKCIAAGCDDYTTKPINREALIALIAQWARTSAKQMDSTQPPTPPPAADDASPATESLVPEP